MSAISGAATGAVVLIALLCLVALFSGRAGDAVGERAGAFVVSLIAVGLCVAVFFSAGAGFTAVGGAVAEIAMAFVRLVQSFGLPVALFQIQFLIAALVIAYLAWRFLNR